MWRIGLLRNARWLHVEAALSLVVARLVYVVPSWLTQLLRAWPLIALCWRRFVMTGAYAGASREPSDDCRR